MPVISLLTGLSVNGPPHARLFDAGVDLGAAEFDALLPTPWVVRRSLRYRTPGWRARFAAMEDEWEARGYNILGPVELAPSEVKRMVRNFD